MRQNNIKNTFSSAPSDIELKIDLYRQFTICAIPLQKKADDAARGIM